MQIVSLYMLGVITICSISQCTNQESSTSICDEKCCSSPNVRTVIFRCSDRQKECWSREELALLFTRRMMQELLPKRKPLAVPPLINYFKDCLDTVKKLATSKKTHTLVVTALADTLGGYLQAFGLPMADQAFYEGTLGYKGAQQLHELQDSIKKLLRTDGGGWTKPTPLNCSQNIEALNVGKAPSGCDPCKSLVLKNDFLQDGKAEVDVLLPFLDDPVFPSAIAFPFKDKNLYSLTSKTSFNVLVKYYSRTLWCLIQTYGTASVPGNGQTSYVPQVRNFFLDFDQWISTNVLNRLNDATLYPAFGSVLRIVESLNKMKDSKSGKIKLRHKSIEQARQLQSVQPDGCGCEPTPRRFYIIVISSLVIAFWLIVLIVYIIYKWFIKKKQDDECSDSDYVTSGSEDESCSGTQVSRVFTDKEYAMTTSPAESFCSDISRSGSLTADESNIKSKRKSQKKKKKKKSKN